MPLQSKKAAQPGAAFELRFGAEMNARL